jgi:hypothetical protein
VNRFGIVVVPRAQRPVGVLETASDQHERVREIRVRGTAAAQV